MPEKYVSVSTHEKRLLKVVTNVRNINRAVKFWFNVFEDPTALFVLIGENKTFCFQPKRQSLTTTKKGKQKNFRQGQKITPELAPKQTEIIPFIAKLFWAPIAW